MYEPNETHVLGIIGSPRRNGNTEILVDEILSGAAESGAQIGKVILDELNIAPCKACNLCIAFCPTKVLEPDRDGKPVLAHPELCNQCEICWLHCPDFAITSTFK